MKIIETEKIKVDIDEWKGCLEVLDKTTRYTWKQIPIDGYTFKDAHEIASGIEIHAEFIRTDEGGKKAPFKLRYTQGKLPSDLCIEVETNLERTISEITYPYPFILDENEGSLVLPRNNGVLYPVKDLTVPCECLQVYRNSGLSMPWFGGIGQKKGYIGIIETPFDAFIQMMAVPYQDSENLINIIYPIWEPSMGKFGYIRRVFYHFISEGNYVVLAKRYRKYAMDIGRFKSLREKLKENPDVEKLIGAPDFWPIGYGNKGVSEKFKIRMARELYRLGVKKLLFSQANEYETIDKIKKLGYLVSSYDVYDDSYYNEKNKSNYPEDVAKLPNGFLLRAWQLRSRKGIFQGYKVCASQAYDNAKRKIPEELKSKKYNSRFIDVVTADAMHECYDKNHPLTRKNWMEYRLKILKLCYDYPIIVGAENGMDWAIPYVHYFEGMAGVGNRYLLSPTQPGHNFLDYIPPQEEYLKIAVGPYYRVPLWELIYHDAVVSTWYWGDGNNRIPELWHLKDLFNVLYGTAPEYLCGEEKFESTKHGVVRSYKNIGPIIEKVGYAEMLSHEFLTSNHEVQRTIFQDGNKNIKITVNFGKQAYVAPEGDRVRPMDYIVHEN